MWPGCCGTSSVFELLQGYVVLSKAFQLVLFSMPKNRYHATSCQQGEYSFSPPFLLTEWKAVRTTYSSC